MYFDNTFNSPGYIASIYNDTRHIGFITDKLEIQLDRCSLTKKDIELLLCFLIEEDYEQEQKARCEDAPKTV